MSTLLGPEETGNVLPGSSDLRATTARTRGTSPVGGGCRLFFENCTVDASIYRERMILFEGLGSWLV